MALGRILSCGICQLLNSDSGRLESDMAERATHYLSQNWVGFSPERVPLGFPLKATQRENRYSAYASDFRLRQALKKKGAALKGWRVYLS